MLVEVTYFLRDCRDFFMQTDEVQSVNSEDFPRSVGEASGKGTLSNNATFISTALKKDLG